MNFNLVILPGDGVGPEVVAQAVKVLMAVGNKYGHRFALNGESLYYIAVVGRKLKNAAV